MNDLAFKKVKCQLWVEIRGGMLGGGGVLSLLIGDTTSQTMLALFPVGIIFLSL